MGEERRIWLGAINDKPDETGAKETDTLFVADCKQLRMRVLQENAFNASGSPQQVTSRDEEKWYYPNPDMVAYRVMQMACGTAPMSGRGFNSLKDADEAYAAKPAAKPRGSPGI